MSETPTDPIRPTDDEARALARALIEGAEHGALGVSFEGAPMVTRIAVATDAHGLPLTLVSRLSLHTGAMLADGQVSLLLGEPGDRGDPLTHPRLTLQASASPIDREAEEFETLATRWLELRPKSKLYIGFSDFLFFRFIPQRAYLNGGFGRAFHLQPGDLR